MKPNLSVIIVHFTDPNTTAACISSLRQPLKHLAYEIIVVNNSDTKLTLPSNLKNLTIINSPKNLGFGAANNLAATRAKGKVLFFLNPDTKFVSGGITKLFHHCQQPAVGAVAPVLVNTQGKLFSKQGTAPLTPVSAIASHSLLSKIWPNNPLARKFWFLSENKDQTYQVGVVPGTAFLIEAAKFHRIGGFDPKFFLYFEESDFCLRCQQHGLSNWINPALTIKHFWGQSTKTLSNHTRGQHYIHSRNYYFNKHYSFPVATLTNFLLQISATHLIIASLLVLTLLPRLYKLTSLSPFIGDFGRDFLAARDMLETGTIPLLGIPSSVPRFHQGPLYIWMLAPFLALTQFQPLGGYLLATLLNTAAVILSFLLVKRHSSLTHAIITALILAASPLVILHARMPFHINAIPLISVIFLATLLEPLRTRYHLIFLTASFWLLFQFELVVFPLILLFLGKLAFSYQRMNRSSLLTIVTTTIASLFPQITYDLTHQFKQLGLFVVWVGYRILSFAIPNQEHHFSLNKLANLFQVLWEYTQKFISWQSALLSIFIVLITLCSLLLKYHRLLLLEKVTLLWIGLAIVAFAVLGNASEAYFPMLFVPAALIIGWALSRARLFPAFFGLAIITVLLTYNLFSTITSDYFLNTEGNQVRFNTYGPPLSDQQTTINFLLTKSSSLNFTSTDPGSHHPSYLDSYRYLAAIASPPSITPATLVWIGQHPSSTPPANSFIYHQNTIRFSLIK